MGAETVSDADAAQMKNAMRNAYVNSLMAKNCTMKASDVSKLLICHDTNGKVHHGPDSDHPPTGEGSLTHMRCPRELVGTDQIIGQESHHTSMHDSDGNHIGCIIIINGHLVDHSAIYKSIAFFAPGGPGIMSCVHGPDSLANPLHQSGGVTHDASHQDSTMRLSLTRRGHVPYVDATNVRMVDNLLVMTLCPAHGDMLHTLMCHSILV